MGFRNHWHYQQRGHSVPVKPERLGLGGEDSILLGWNHPPRDPFHLLLYSRTEGPHHRRVGYSI